ncbi:PREDICTED: complement receptor type 2-like isoform X1 [Thamnophis sirtalis]|uniref:Complement receptor type 2-like isoform X1 n=1 Tax=Thamnophis sirtalis TaxID=35019 RepID=A0A6I9X9T2_9SAUR|nr:PREDICTED: complement receptor type 2-like isoform X1 [Thamnophis sirtalis]
MMALSCNQGGFLAWMLLLLSLTHVQTQCPTPDLPPHSSLREGEVLADNYPAGTNLELQCLPGYEFIIKRNYWITCLDSGKWSILPMSLCEGPPVFPTTLTFGPPCGLPSRLPSTLLSAAEFHHHFPPTAENRNLYVEAADHAKSSFQRQRCPIPKIENGHAKFAIDIKLGMKVTLACNHGFRMIGNSTISCVMKSGKLDWDKDLPVCERIPCVRPPLIANGRYDPNLSDVYDTGAVVIYRCDTDYSLIGQSTITCVVPENSVVGEWNWPSPECKKVKCHRPRIPNGRVISVFQDVYTYQNKIVIECNPGYVLVGSSIIKCDADSQWKPPGPWCDKRK